MLRSRILLIVVSMAAMAGLFFLPKAVVENDNQLKEDASSAMPAGHGPAVPDSLRQIINHLRERYLSTSSEEKNAIFADSLAAVYARVSMFDSAAWYAERAALFFKTEESELKTANAYFQAFSFSADASKQKALASTAQQWLKKVLEKHPGDLTSKTRLAMTYVTSSSPMQGIAMLREVLAEDPKHEEALFSMGMLSVESGQFEKAVEWLKKLEEVSPRHTQGQLLLGVAYMNLGQKENAVAQFNKVKKMDQDPSVQATVDSYLQELK